MDNPRDLYKTINLAPDNTALIVIDMQVDFCSSSGFAAQRGKKLTQIQNIIGKLDIFARKLLDLGVLVIYTKFISGVGITPGNLSKAVLNKKYVFSCIKGSGGEDLYKIEVPRGAVLIEKPHYDSFAYTALKQLLSEKGIKNLLVTGLRTELCVDATAKRAASEGYDTFIINDLVATYDDKLKYHEQVLDFFNTYYGFVINSYDVLDILDNKKITKHTIK
jgi:ureidoacrylate peracid hydrolase